MLQNLVTIDGKPRYLVAQTAAISGNVTGLGLATTPGGVETSFGAVDPQRANHVTMVASLVPVTPSSNDNAGYGMDSYTGHPAYKDVVRIFQSLAGSLPE
jgi:hypothetical protein